MKDGKIERNFFVGMTVRQIDDKIAKYYRLGKQDGILVYQIDSKSAANDAGIEAGDIIEKIDGKNISKTDDLLIAIGDAVVGDRLRFEILRGNKKINVSLLVPPQSKQRRQ
jgi:S1-C subfamily serine protease